MNFLELSRKQARCTLLCLAFIQHAAVRIPSFSSDTQLSLQTIHYYTLTHHIQEIHIYIGFPNTSFFFLLAHAYFPYNITTVWQWFTEALMP